MVATTYEIGCYLSPKAYADLTSLPNLMEVTSVNAGTPSQTITLTFDHTPDQAIAFKKYLANRTQLYGDNLAKYTNFDAYSLMYSTDTPRTFTNIGTTFVNVYNRSDGMSFGMDIDVYLNVRMVVHWTKGATDTGTHTVQIIDKATSTVLISMNVVSGVNNSPITAIPSTFNNSTKLYLVQAKSTVASDDPTFEGIRVYMA